MTRLWDPRLVLLNRPVPITIGRGGLVPMLVFAGLFAAIGASAGLPIAAVAAVAAFGAGAGTASLIAHELGHVRAARRLDGPRPVAISLIWLGAATRLEGAYASGGDQARVAAGGPRASFAVAIALVPTLFAPIPVELKELVLFLIALNVAIGAMSLIPAKPLDGYKLVVGLLWSALGSQTAARRLVRRVGLTWAAVEVAGTCVLLVEKPLLGALVIALAAILFGQKLLARRVRA
jgi:Zn-dependent protease